MDWGYLDVGMMNKVKSLHLRYVIPTKDNPKVLRYNGIEIKYCDGGGFPILFSIISYNPEGDPLRQGLCKLSTIPAGRGMISLSTNRDVNETNFMELAETYREKRGIENGYQKKSDTKEKTHSHEMGMRYFLLFFSVLLYNLGIILNLLRGMSRHAWITLIDFIIAMSRRDVAQYYEWSWMTRDRQRPVEPGNPRH